MFYNDEITERTLQLAAGDHQLSFHFQEYDDNLQARNDKIRIYVSALEYFVLNLKHIRHLYTRLIPNTLP